MGPGRDACCRAGVRLHCGLGAPKKFPTMTVRRSVRSHLHSTPSAAQGRRHFAVGRRQKRERVAHPFLE